MFQHTGPGLFLFNWNSNPSSTSFMEFAMLSSWTIHYEVEGHPLVHVMISTCDSDQLAIYCQTIVWIHLGDIGHMSNFWPYRLVLLTSDRCVSPARAGAPLNVACTSQPLVTATTNLHIYCQSLPFSGSHVKKETQATEFRAPYTRPYTTTTPQRQTPPSTPLQIVVWL